MFQIREGIQIRPEEWGAIVIDRWFEEILELDQAGLDILQEVDGAASVRDISCRLSQKWDVNSGEALEITMSFLTELEKNGIIYDLDNLERLKIIEKLRDSTYNFRGFVKDLTLSIEEPSLIRIYKPLKAPILVTFDVTTCCNLRCKYCYVRAGQKLLQELTTEQIKSVIDELAALGVFWISISGGEPLIRDDICEIVQYCVAKGFSTSITTNGTLLTAELASKLRETGVKRVQISIDSADPHPHEAMRGEGTHEQALRGLTYLKEAGFPFIGVSCVPTKLNLKDIPHLIDWVHEHCESIPLRPYGRLGL